MNHNSANLAFGRREKNIWGYKKVQGGKKPIRGSKKFVGGGKNEQGAPNGNVTPLGSCLLAFYHKGRLRYSGEMQGHRAFG